MPGLAVVVAGSPCAGKTTLVAAIAAELGAAIVDKDTLEWPLANAAMAAAGLDPFAHESELYKSVLKHAVYETMERVAEQNTRCRLPVVLVAPFSSHVKDPEWYSRLQARLGVHRLLVIWATARPDVLLARKAKRAAGRDLIDGPGGDPTLFAVSEAARSPPVAPHFFLDMTGIAQDDMCAQALAALHHCQQTGSSPPTPRDREPGGVICAGHACVDVVMEQCDELSSREGYASVERFTLGGSVSNTAMQLASLGVIHIEAMTVLGDDAFGRLLLAAWKEAGAPRPATAPTLCTVLPVYKADSKRAVYACPGTNATIDGTSMLPPGESAVLSLQQHSFFTLGYPT